MEEADILCDRIGIIDKGKIIALDTPSKLKKMIASDIIKLKLKKKNSQDIETLRSFTFIHKIESININDEQIFILSVDNASHNLPIILKYIDVESVEFTSHYIKRRISWIYWSRSQRTARRRFYGKICSI